ncbi:MAG: hypothetical protein BZ137_07315 [Methanosphaera sp. rholeuAM130]|nr:MAG: hypothetical protein BZ137_07315 [Methanosphaera sp. rholeuAM130]
MKLKIKGDYMDINNVTKGKIVPLGIIIIIITYLISGSSSSITPYILFTGIIIGLVKNQSVAESAVAGGLASLIGSFIVTILTLGFTYMIYGSLYLQYMLSSSLLYLAIYTLVGVIGGILGYYISKELEI